MSFRSLSHHPLKAVALQALFLALLFTIATCTAPTVGTAPPTGQATPGAVQAAPPTRLLIAGDSRGEPGFQDVLQAAKTILGKDQPLFGLITPGDNDPVATSFKQFNAVFGDHDGIVQKSLPRWYPAIGNHEVGATGEITAAQNYYKENLAKFCTAGPVGCSTTTYSFDAGAMHIAIIDEYWNGEAKEGADPKPKGTIVEPLRAWLEADLKASHKPFKIVVGHEPAYPQEDRDYHVGRHVGESLDRDPKTRDAFWKTLEDQHATLMICGHTHRYSRYQPPGSSVFQLDAAQARNDSSWKYDAFIILASTPESLKIDTYRQPKTQGQWQITDTVTVPAK